MWDPYAEFQSATLSNGLTVHAAHWPGRPWEAVGFLIHSGAEHDPVGFEGLAHFVEHLISENANVSKKDFYAFFEDNGGAVNLGATGYSCTRYHFFAPADASILSKAFSMFGIMLFSAKLEKFIERERQVIIGEFHRDYPTKSMFELDARRSKALYAGYWLERFVRPLGVLESIQRITQNELQSYYDTHYTPANMSIVGVGGATLSELVGMLSQSPFAINKEGVRTQLPDPVVNVAPLSETRYVFEMSKYVTDSMIVGSYGSVAKIPGDISIVAIMTLQQMLNEILNEEVRERRAWAYNIDTSYQYYHIFYEFSINCNGLALKAFNEIEDVIEVCIASITDREDLFRQVKRRGLASCLMLDPTGKSVRDRALDELADHQRIISLAEYIRDAEQMTFDDVRDLLQWFKPERRWTLIVRP